MAVIDKFNINGTNYDLIDNSKVAINQGVAQAGKALVVGADGAVTLGEAGVPQAVSEALLACFEKVAWIDGNGQDYYDALEAALNGEPQPEPETWDTDWSYTDGDPVNAGFTWTAGNADTHVLTSNGLEITGFSKFDFPGITSSKNKVVEVEFVITSFSENNSTPIYQLWPKFLLRNGDVYQGFGVADSGFYVMDSNRAYSVKIGTASLNTPYKLRMETTGTSVSVHLNDVSVGTFDLVELTEADDIMEIMMPSYRSGKLLITAMRCHM